MGEIIILKAYLNLTHMDLILESLLTNAVSNLKCDHPAALTSFDGAAYMGTWYEQVHIKCQIFEPADATCVTAEYSDLQADGHFVVTNSMQSADFGARSGITGTGYCPNGDGKCHVSFSNQGENDFKTNYQVIDTDYTSYAVVYACGLAHPFLWLLTREAVASDDLYSYMMSSAAEKLPNFNFGSLTPREYQGAKCTYDNSFESLMQ